MYIERVPNRNSPPAVLLRESFRVGTKVKKRTLANLSKLPHHAVETLRRVLRGETLVAHDDSFSCLRSLPHGHVAAVLGTLRRLQLHTLISRAPSRFRELVIALIVARVIDPRSKLATARALNPETAVSTLGELLRLGDVAPLELYDAMDWLLRRQAGIEKRLARRHLHENTLVLYDLTSTYLEGTHCPLARRGYSRDGKKGKLQIVFGLLCSPDGCPIAVEVFKGSTSDPKTVACQVNKLRVRFRLARVVLVADRGMLTSARIREDLAGVEGLRWITSLRAPAIKKLIADRTVSPSLFDQRDLAEVTSDDFPGERLIVCRNPRLAAERCRKRRELLDATEKLLEPIAGATQREKRPLRGQGAIGIRLGKVIDRYKVAKHFATHITEDSFTFERLPEQIAAEELLDGIYIIRSNVEPERLDADQTVRAYKDLSKVERAFRSLKSVDLKVRPIHPPTTGSRPSPHPALHARLLRRVAPAQGTRPAALRRPRPRNRPASPLLRRQPRKALTRRPRQSRPKAHPRRPPRPQLPILARRSRHLLRQHNVPRRHRKHLHPPPRTHARTATIQRSPPRLPPHVASPTTPKIA